jgi:hypothetical protein
VADLSSKVCLVYDCGGKFSHIAESLAPSFQQTLYYVPWSNYGAPTTQRRMLGLGMPETTRAYSWLNHLAAADLVVFPDVYNWDEAQAARDLGRPVWGAGRAEALETERWKTREIMAELGMPVIPAELIVGLDALRAHLKDAGERYIKCSVTRGDFETQHFENAAAFETWFAVAEQKLGPMRDEFEFISEEPIEGSEVGYDGAFIAGEYAPIAAYGWEKKDKLYIGKVMETARMPAAIRQVNQSFQPALAALAPEGGFNYSNEIRIGKDGTPYLIDPTCRCGWPPSPSLFAAFSNWAEVMYRGARSQMVALRPRAQYLAEIVLSSEWTKDGWLRVEYPDEIARWIRLSNSAVIDGGRVIMPQEYKQCGSAVGLGDSPKEAIEQAKHHAEQVVALDLEFEHDPWTCAKRMIEEGADSGIEF